MERRWETAYNSSECRLYCCRAWPKVDGRCHCAAVQRYQILNWKIQPCFWLKMERPRSIAIPRGRVEIALTWCLLATLSVIGAWVDVRIWGTLQLENLSKDRAVLVGCFQIWDIRSRSSFQLFIMRVPKVVVFVLKVCHRNRQAVRTQVPPGWK